MLQSEIWYIHPNEKENYFISTTIMCAGVGEKGAASSSDTLLVGVGESWRKALQDEFNKPYFQTVSNELFYGNFGLFKQGLVAQDF